MTALGYPVRTSAAAICATCRHPKAQHIAVPKPRRRPGSLAMVPGWCYPCRYERASTNHPCTRFKRIVEPRHNGYHDRGRR